MAQNPTLTPVSHAKAPFYWGIDVGGTGIKIGLVDDEGRTLAFETIPTVQSDGPTEAMQRVAEVIAQDEQELGVVGQVVSAGLGAPGPMDLPRGILVSPPQLPAWWGFNIRDCVAELLGRPVAFINDANAAAYGEFWLGSGRDDKSMLLLTLGTGVGGGIIVDGELVHGVNSCGGECGHIIVDPSPDAQLCIWGGGRGHLEAYASASAVVIRTKDRLLAGEPSVLNDHVAELPAGKSLTSKMVYQAAKDGDGLALAVVDDTAKWLGVGVTTIVHTLDPGSVVLGGAMNFGGAGSPLGQRFLDGVSEEFKRRTFDSVFKGTTIQFATLGADAGYLGAAGYARKVFPQG